MCDNNNCPTGSLGSPPELLPGWFRCPAAVTQMPYPVPQGVQIKPISYGGRNGSKSISKKFKCGKCGQDDKPPEKPRASPDCPMMKARCPGLDKSGGGKGFFAKLKEFFGIGKDSELYEMCQKLHIRVPEEQQRDIFNSELVARKDGYLAPFFMEKVNCEGNDCDGLDEEETNQNDDDCEEESEVEEQEFEGDDCEYEDGEEGQGGEYEEEEEEECIQDAEGECILEETAECLDEDCKLFLEKDKNKKKGKKKEKDGKICEEMQNFLIRVQSPYYDSTTNETCEQIIAKLTSNMYPEPPAPQPKKKTSQVKLVVTQISLEEPTCETRFDTKEAPKKEDDSPPEPPKPPPEVPITAPPPPPEVQDSKPEEPAEVSQPPNPSDCDCKPAEVKVESVQTENPCACASPPAGICPQPEGVPCPPPTDCDCSQPDPCQDAPPTTEEEFERFPREPRPVPPPPIDCNLLSEDELLRTPLRLIKCPGCEERVKCFNNQTSGWNPPPPPSCARCGAAVRGTTEDCYFCQLTQRMRSGCPEETPPRPKPKSSRCASYPATILPVTKEDNADYFCKPEYLPDGSLKYKGGMCMSLANSYLLNAFRKIPAGGFFDKFSGACGDGEKLKAHTGLEDREEARRVMYAKENPPLKYEGGNSAENVQFYLWGKKPPPKPEPEPPRKCPTPRSEPANKCPRPKDG